MPDESVALRIAPGARMRTGLQRRANWLQLVRFGIVGVSGYAVNVVAFAVALHSLSLDYRVGPRCRSWRR